MKRSSKSRHPAVRMAGYGLVGLIIAGLALGVLAATISNHPFYGTSYWGLPLGTYSSLAVLAVIAAVGLTWAIRLMLRGSAGDLTMIVEVRFKATNRGTNRPLSALNDVRF